MAINKQTAVNSDQSNQPLNSVEADLSTPASPNQAPIAPPVLTARGLDITAVIGNPPKQFSGQGLSWLNWKALSLRTKATVLAIALGTLPTLAIGSIGYLVQRNFVRQEVARSHQNRAIDAVDKLTRFVFERYGDIQVLANLPMLRDLKLSTATSLQQKEQVLTQFAETYQVYDSIAVYGLDGNLIISGGKEKAPANNTDREYFQMALKTGQPYISQPDISKITKTVNIFFAAPVKDAVTGKTIAVVRTRMPVKDMEQVIQSYGNAANQLNYHFFDRSGHIFMATEQDQKGDDVNTDFADGLANLRAGGKPGTWIGHDQNQKTVETLNAFVPTQGFQGMPDVKWGLVYTINTTTAFKAVNEQLLILAAGTGAVAIIVGILGVLLAERATRPIKLAAQTVAQIGQGDLSARLAVAGTDEFAVLGTNINYMAAEIELLVDNQKAETERLDVARQEARQDADISAQQQREAKEFLQKRALQLLMEVDPVSRGDLTIRAKVTADEIGTVADSYNAIIGSLRQIVQQVQGATQTVTETAQANESSVKLVATQSIQQASAIANALKQIQVLAESSQGVADRAKQAEIQVQQANQVVQAGDTAMNRTVSGISAIRETVSETAKKVKRLGDASQKISKVVNLISGFAAQTNLLALNAAIEAARAGEEGRGFSVVAEEVRALAQQSAAATAEIEQLVEEIQTQTNEVVTAMETGTEQVVAGSQLVEESRQQLSQISAGSMQVNQLIQEIAQAAATQTETSTAVRQTMQDVATIATDSSQQSEEVANSFSQLLEVAQALQVSVAQFKVN